MSERFARYKGKEYRLLYLGQSKFGLRAKLAFLDHSKTFWVDGSLVTELSHYPDSISDGKRGRRRCACACHRGGGGPCFECQHDECEDS